MWLIPYSYTGKLDINLKTRKVYYRLQRIRANFLLLLAAFLWGFAFVAQRVGMKHVEPFIFNGVRFGLGSIPLIPLMINRRRQRANKVTSGSKKILSLGGFLAGLVLFTAVSLQQVGIIYTTAGKAGFITGLYVIIVPILGLLIKYRPSMNTWFGATLAAVGLYLLSVTGGFHISRGDLLVLIGAFFWAIHVHIIGWFSKRADTIVLAFLQFVICSILCLIISVSIETITIQGLSKAIIPILYGGFVSVGIAYTLQVVAQRYTLPSHAAIILSMETVFAAIGGWLILGEILNLRGYIGCVLIFTGIILSQLNIRSGSKPLGEKQIEIL
jgi:drug/metabolite transporter (DMT)-like permease